MYFTSPLELIKNAFCIPVASSILWFACITTCLTSSTSIRLLLMITLVSLSICLPKKVCKPAFGPLYKNDITEGSETIFEFLKAFVTEYFSSNSTGKYCLKPIAPFAWSANTA